MTFSFQSNQDSVQSIATAAGTTSLLNTSPTLTIFTGSSTQIVKLPDATTCQLGQFFKLQNVSTSATKGSVTIQISTGTVLTSISQNNGVLFECVQTGVNTAASWLQIGNDSEVIEASDTNIFNPASPVIGTYYDIPNVAVSLPPGSWQILVNIGSVQASWSTGTGAAAILCVALRVSGAIAQEVSVGLIGDASASSGYCQLLFGNASLEYTTTLATTATFVTSLTVAQFSGTVTAFGIFARNDIRSGRITVYRLK